MKRIILCLLLLMTINVFALNVDGEFNGWEGETAVKLSDGSWWVQSGYEFNYCYGYNPKADLYNENGTIKLLINGCGNIGIPVEQLSNVIESKIDGEFKGFEGSTIFKLRNGSVWKQKKYKYWYRYASSPECFVYNHNGWKLSVLGKVIEVEKINN